MNPPGGKPFTSQGVVRSLENAVRLATLTAPLLRGLTSSLMGSGVSGGKQATQKRIATSRSQTEKKPSPPIIKVKSAPTSFSSSSAKPQGTLSNGKCGRAQLCEQGSYIPSERHYYRQIIGTCVTNASSVLCLNLTGTDVTYGVQLTPSFEGQHTTTPMALAAKTHLYYANRAVKLRYVPTVSTSTGGALVFAVCDNPLVNYLDRNDFHEICAMIPSVTTSVWSPTQLEYKYDGVRTYSCSTANSSGYLPAYSPGYLCYSGVGLSASSTYGYLEGEFVIDFYGEADRTTYPSRDAARPVGLEGLSVQIPPSNDEKTFVAKQSPLSLNEASSSGMAATAITSTGPDSVLPPAKPLLVRDNGRLQSSATSALQRR